MPIYFGDRSEDQRFICTARDQLWMSKTNSGDRRGMIIERSDELIVFVHIEDMNETIATTRG